MNCTSLASVLILWNGEKLDSFQPLRGIRQCHSLSPYLFVLCMEVLSQQINTAVSEGAWKGVHLSRQGALIPIYVLLMISYCLE